jgi:hypothetical protein
MTQMYNLGPNQENHSLSRFIPVSLIEDQVPPLHVLELDEVGDERLIVSDDNVESDAGWKLYAAVPERGKLGLVDDVAGRG